MSTNVLPNPQYWRDRAEKARLHAERMIEPVSKRMMIEVAEHYEGLVRRAGKRLLESANRRAAESYPDANEKDGKRLRRS
jgi:hypothetical protein